MNQASNNFNNRVRQGDIFSNIEYIEYAVEKNGAFEISKIVFPFVIVLTQDCDLEQDFNDRLKNGVNPKPSHDRHLISVIVAPLYNINHFRVGEHLSELGLIMQTMSTSKNNTSGKYLLSNRLPRYHYLSFEESVPVPDSIIDFKHYFSVNVEMLLKQREQNFVCDLPPFHREDVSHRFAGFLSRIGLPNPLVT